MTIAKAAFRIDKEGRLSEATMSVDLSLSADTIRMFA